MSKAKKAQKAKPIYWHGGAFGRSRDDFILPATQVPEMKLHYANLSKAERGTYQLDFAYVTTNRGLAFNYARRYAQAMGKPGALYRVAPHRPLSPDEDYPHGVSFYCPRAVVLEVLGGPIKGSEQINIQGLRASIWQDGTQLYDFQGYPLPNKVQQHFGVTRADLRGLGIAAEMKEILTHAEHVLKMRNPGITQAQLNAVDPTLA